MKYWIKSKIESLLGIDDLKKEIKILKSQNQHMRKAINDSANDIKSLQQLFDVGIDAHVNPQTRDSSWAVVCLKGKPDYIKFVNLGHSELHVIKSFLKKFEQSNIIFDAPPDVFMNVKFEKENGFSHRW